MKSIKMAAAVRDEYIKVSVQETDGFIDVSRGRTGKDGNEERNEVGEKTPDPSHKRASYGMGRAQSNDQPLSEMWRNPTENLQQMCLISEELSHRMYEYYVEDPNVCELLIMLVHHYLRCMKWSCKLIIAAIGRAIFRFVNHVRSSSLFDHLSRFSQKIFDKKTKKFYGTDPNETKVLIDDDEHEYEEMTAWETSEDPHFIITHV